ncbi:MAG: cupin domain-containing protein [Planctomycetes bacterium]|nr:cupin domain-containing protein [Planctomycetota bacterium]
MAKAMFDAATVAAANLLVAAPIVPGGIVSKTLLNDEHAKLVLFAMDQGQAISEHQAPYVAAVHVLEGRLQFGVGGRSRVMTAHDWLVMPANEKHDLSALEPVRFLLTLLK